jgi:hypothetical protein
MLLRNAFAEPVPKNTRGIQPVVMTGAGIYNWS